MNDIAPGMERDWDARAREAPAYYIANGRREWDEEEFFRSGRINVDNEVLADDEIIRLGEARRSARILEIGCGAGRMTRALSAEFGEIHAVDISAEMIALAFRNLAGLNNVHLHKNNGRDLAELPDGYFGFAFSYIVFQHISSLDVIESYVSEVYRCLQPGGVFKFQVQGATEIKRTPRDSWTGAPVSYNWAAAVAERCGFEVIRSTGERTQYFWLWFRKPGRSDGPCEGRSQTQVLSVSLSPACVLPGGSYRVRIPDLANQTIDVSWELVASGITGVLANWCRLDARGEAVVAVPAEQPPGVVRIARVRSNTLNGAWRMADATMEVISRTNLADDFQSPAPAAG